MMSDPVESRPELRGGRGASPLVWLILGVLVVLAFVALSFWFKSNSPSAESTPGGAPSITSDAAAPAAPSSPSARP